MCKMKNVITRNWANVKYPRMSMYDDAHVNVIEEATKQAVSKISS